MTVVKKVLDRWPNWFTLEIDGVCKGSHCVSVTYQSRLQEGRRWLLGAKSVLPPLQGAETEGGAATIGLSHLLGLSTRLTYVLKPGLLPCWGFSFVKVGSLSLILRGYVTLLTGEVRSSPHIVLNCFCLQILPLLTCCCPLRKCTAPWFQFPERILSGGLGHPEAH